MKKNKILSLIAMLSLWNVALLGSLEQLRQGHYVVVLTKDQLGVTRTYVSEVPEDNTRIAPLVESQSPAENLQEGKVCQALPVPSSNQGEYAIQVSTQDLAQQEDKESLPLYLHFTLQVQQGQELLRVMIVKNNFFEDRAFDVNTVADFVVEEELDDLDALLATSTTVPLESIEKRTVPTLSKTKQFMLSVSLFLIEQYNNSQKVLAASSEWLKNLFA